MPMPLPLPRSVGRSAAFLLTRTDPGQRAALPAAGESFRYFS